MKRNHTFVALVLVAAIAIPQVILFSHSRTKPAGFSSGSKPLISKILYNRISKTIERCFEEPITIENENTPIGLIRSASSLADEAERQLNLIEEFDAKEFDLVVSKARQKLRLASELYQTQTKTNFENSEIYEPANQVFIKLLRYSGDKLMSDGDWNDASIMYAQAICRNAKKPEDSKFEFLPKRPHADVVLHSFENWLTVSANSDGYYNANLATADMIAVAQACDMDEQFSYADSVYRAAIPHIRSTNFCRHCSNSKESIAIVKKNFERVFEFAKEKLIGNGAYLATRYEYLASFYTTTRDDNKAIKPLEQAIAIRESNPPKDPQSISLDIKRMKRILSDSDRENESRMLNPKLFAYLRELNGGKDSAELGLILRREELSAAEKRCDHSARIAILERLYKLQSRLETEHAPLSPFMTNSTSIFDDLVRAHNDSNFSKDQVLNLVNRFKMHCKEHAPADEQDRRFLDDTRDILGIMLRFQGLERVAKAL